MTRTRKFEEIIKGMNYVRAESPNTKQFFCFKTDGFKDNSNTRTLFFFGFDYM